jgi:hypothetical protein
MEDVMIYLGMLALGGFVGGLLTWGLQFVQAWRDFSKAVTFILGAAFSGASFGFLQYLLKTNPAGAAASTYPIGLLLALMWFYASIAIDNIRSQDRQRKILGWGHIAGLVAINMAAAALVLPPAFREAWK